ncbi:MAG TPA: glutathionylspermidine synthase family protein [Myxococcota bacterium]
MTTTTKPIATNEQLAAYAEFAARITGTGFINDPWLDDEPRFGMVPVGLRRRERDELIEAGEQLAAVIDEAVKLLLDDDVQRAQFLPLLPTAAALLTASNGLWHGIARADVFVTKDGLQVTELNSDTPTGEPEAIVLGVLAREDAEASGLVVADDFDTCASMPARLAQLWRAMHDAIVNDDIRREHDDGGARVAAIVYPTEFTEDLSLVRLYRQILEESGWRVVLGSPFNLDVDDDQRLVLFGERPTLVLRHYKTDWWTERQSVWLDDTVADAEPLQGPLAAVLAAQAAGTCVVVNPFGAVASQNKRLLAFCWERIHRFSTAAQQSIQRLIPYTARLESVHEAQLRADKASWVIKSDYGAEGDEVIIGKLVDDATWDATLRLARPGRFIAQRFFEAVPDEAGFIRNHGVFVVGGVGCGIYTRLDRGFTDPASLSVATVVVTDEAEDSDDDDSDD